LDGGRWSLVAEFTEIESGKRDDRPELEQALAACKRQKAKLVIAKLDRLIASTPNVSVRAKEFRRWIEENSPYSDADAE
jgi:DNA invertase Pin-like site-specific DNA recombinase